MVGEIAKEDSKGKRGNAMEEMTAPRPAFNLFPRLVVENDGRRLCSNEQGVCVVAQKNAQGGVVREAAEAPLPHSCGRRVSLQLDKSTRLFVKYDTPAASLAQRAYAVHIAGETLDS